MRLVTGLPSGFPAEEAELAEMTMHPRQTGREIAKSVPFVGSTLEAVDAVDLLMAARRVNAGEERAGDLTLIDEAVRKSKEQPTFWGSVDEILRRLPAFAGEIALTGGVYNVGKKMVEGAATKLAQKAATKAGERAASTIATRGAVGAATKAAGVVGGAAAQATALPQYTVQGTAEQMLKGDEFAEALAKGYGLSVVELASERSGGLANALADRAGLSALKKAVAARWIGLRPNRTMDDFLQKVSDRTGWHGVIGEVFEERLSETGRGTITGEYKPPTLQQLAAEAAAFSVPGLAAGGMRAIGGGLDTAAGDVPTSPVTQAPPRPAAIPSGFRPMRPEEAAASARPTAPAPSPQPDPADTGTPTGTQFQPPAIDPSAPALRSESQPRAEGQVEASLTAPGGRGAVTSSTTTESPESLTSQSAQEAAQPTPEPTYQPPHKTTTGTRFPAPAVETGQPEQSSLQSTAPAAGGKQAIERSAGEESPDDMTSARKVDIARDREALGLDELDSPARRSWQSTLDKAKADKVHERADRIAAEVNAKPRALDDVETAGLVVRAAELKNEHARLMQEVGDSTDAADIAFRSAEAHRVEQEFDALSTALRRSGTEKGRALALQKLTIDRDFRLVSVLNRAKAAKGKEIKASDRKEFEEIVRNLEESDRKVSQLEQRVQTLEAERTLRRQPRNLSARNRGDAKLQALYAKADMLLKAGCH